VSTTVAAALAAARAAGVERLDAQRLLGGVLERSREWLIAHDDAVLDATATERFSAAVQRRARGEPLAYLLGEKEFHGLAFEVTPAVLVPRPETEGLVEWALECLDAVRLERPRVLDLGTGSGAIAVAIGAARPKAQLCASDVDGQALALARRNASRHGVPLEASLGPWWEPWAGRRFDLVVSNPPYVADADPHLAALHAEPRHALAAGPDGLDALRLIVAGAADHLERGGALLLEHGFDQAEAVRALLASHGFEEIRTRPDLAGLPRCSGGRRR
jgi:release factor glutamine methyltransferase